MKIVYMLTTPDSGAGTERTLFTQAALMAERHDVTILGVFRTANRPHYKVDKRVRLEHLVDARPGHDPGGPSRLVPSEWDNQFTAESDRAIAAALPNLSADVVVTSTPALASLAAEFLRPGVAIVHQEHRPSMLRGEGILPLVACSGRIDMITSLTQRSQDWLVERLGFGAPRLEVVENPLEPGFVPRSSLSNKLIVAAGRFTFQKRFDHLVRAFAVANELVPGWRLRIFGDGPLGDKLRNEVWHRELVGLVDISPPTARMAAEMSKASIYAMSSRYEGLPMVGIEAAAAGLPLVAYDVLTGPAEIVDKAGGGLLAPNGSIEGLGSALALLMGSPDTLQELSARALQGASSFAPDVLRRRWDTLFAEVVESKSSGRAAGGRRTSLASERTGAEDDAGPTFSEMGPGDDAGERLVAGLNIPERRSAVRKSAIREVVDMIAGCLDDAGVTYARLANVEHGADIAVSERDRTAMLDAVGRLVADQGWVLDAYRGDGQLNLGSWTVPADAPPTMGFATHVEVSRSAAEPGTPKDERPPKVAVELWRNDGDLLRAPRRNAAVDWVDAETWRQWSASGTDSVSGAPMWSQIDFPIDVVYTWVDGSDAVWSAKRSEYTGSPRPSTDDGSREARYVSRDELYYSVAGVRKYMPWVRHVFIVTDNQVPQRVVDEFPEVRIVDHQDIFPDPSVLPVFNSHAIEACVHRIPGLSEHFVYFNDDMIPMRPLDPSLFFTANGLAKFFPSPVKINYGGFDDLPHQEAASNNRALILRDFGIEITQGMLHTPYAHKCSVLEELEQRYETEIAKTRSSRFRSGADHSVTSSLGQYYGFATGKYLPGEVNYRYVSLQDERIFARMRSVLENGNLQFIALGEPSAEETGHYDEDVLVEAFLSRIVD